MRFVRRLALLLALALLVSGLAAGARALLPPGLELEAPDAPLSDGSRVHLAVTSYGRPTAWRLELSQGAATRVLARGRVRPRASEFWDLRPQRAATGVRLARGEFRSGPARLRLVAESNPIGPWKRPEVERALDVALRFDAAGPEPAEPQRSSKP